MVQCYKKFIAGYLDGGNQMVKYLRDGLQCQHSNMLCASQIKFSKQQVLTLENAVTQAGIEFAKSPIIKPSWPFKVSANS